MCHFLSLFTGIMSKCTLSSWTRGFFHCKMREVIFYNTVCNSLHIKALPGELGIVQKDSLAITQAETESIYLCTSQDVFVYLCSNTFSEWCQVIKHKSKETDGLADRLGRCFDKWKILINVKIWQNSLIVITRLSLELKKLNFIRAVCVCVVWSDLTDSSYMI